VFLQECKRCCTTEKCNARILDERKIVHSFTLDKGSSIYRDELWVTLFISFIIVMLIHQY